MHGLNSPVYYNAPVPPRRSVHHVPSNPKFLCSGHGGASLIADALLAALPLLAAIVGAVIYHLDRVSGAASIFHPL